MTEIKTPYVTASGDMITKIDASDIEKALMRVERCMSTVDDANLLRSVIAGLQGQVQVLTIGLDDEAYGGYEREREMPY